MIILDKYILKSLLKTAFITLLLCTFMMIMIELFINFSTYTSSYMNFKRVITLLTLRLPYAVNMVVGPSLLFATTFLVSSFYSNNEIIALLSAGFNYRRIILPILIFALLLSGGMFLFNEYVYVPSITKYDNTLASYRDYDMSKAGDNTNIFYIDRVNNSIIRASKYTDITKELTNLELIYKDENNRIKNRITAKNAKWDDEKKCWILKDTIHYTIDRDKFDLVINTNDVFEATDFNTDYSLFKSIRKDIYTMNLSQAHNYVKEIKTLSLSRYSEVATGYYERILSCLTVFVMTLVSVSINLRGFRNILLVAITESISLAVIYYVVQLVTMLLAKQGLIYPIFGMLVPIIIITVISLISQLTIKS